MGGQTDLETLKDACGDRVSASLQELKEQGVLCCETDAKRRIGDKTRRMVELAVPAEEAMALAEQTAQVCTHAAMKWCGCCAPWAGPLPRICVILPAPLTRPSKRWKGRSW